MRIDYGWKAVMEDLCKKYFQKYFNNIRPVRKFP